MFFSFLWEWLYGNIRKSKSIHITFPGRKSLHYKEIIKFSEDTAKSLELKKKVLTFWVKVNPLFGKLFTCWECYKHCVVVEKVSKATNLEIGDKHIIQGQTKVQIFEARCSWLTNPQNKSYFSYLQGAYEREGASQNSSRDLQHYKSNQLY